MSKNWKSKFVAAAIALVVAAGVSTGQAIVFPSVAEAGVLSKVKGAAKTVGGAVKTTAQNLGGAARAAGALGKQVGGGVGSHIKRAAVRVGKEAARTPIGTSAKYVGKGAKVAASKIRKAFR